MKKIRLSLIALSAVCAVAASAMSFAAVAAADDDYREITLTGTNVFYTGTSTDSASIATVRVADDSDEGYTDYTAFLMSDGQSVTYRKNLAYNWWSADDNGYGVNGKFEMVIGFDSIEFSSYTIAFQSQQYNITDNGVSDNYLVFKPTSEGTLALYISESDDVDDEDEPSVVLEDYSSITIAFGDFESGDYTILINGEAAGLFVNVSENYASYVSSGDSAATPLTFTVDFDDSDEDASVNLIMYSLNGQSFQVYDAAYDDDGVLTGGTIRDDQAPVICLDSGLNYLTYGDAVDIEYTVIDVIASSPRSTVMYYVLSNEQFEAEDYDYNDYSDDSDLFMEVSTSSDYRLLRDQYTYVPDLDEVSGIVENENGYTVYGLVKVCIYVRDTTSSRAQTDYVFMDWYVPDEYKVDISDLSDDKESTASSTFIMMLEDNLGATYTNVNAEGYDGDDVTDLQSYKDYIAWVQSDYQAKIDAYIADENIYPDGLFASSDTNLYLPDFSGYVIDNLGGYTDLTYSIYYTTSSTGSVTGLSSDSLAISISEANTYYRFTIYVTDAAGNEMYYPDEDGNIQTISTDDIWDEDYAELLPFFEIYVEYRAATVEDPGVQSVGYVGSTYNSASFDITGVSGTYSAVYNLYIFDRDSFYVDTGVELSYDDVVNNAYALFFNEYVDDDGNAYENTRKYFTLVTDDEEFEDYEWSSSNVTFVPQDASEFYVVRLTLTDTGLSNQVTDSFLVVRASARAAEIYGEDDWLENNIAAIVLFCVAGVFFIAFIVLLVVKPKDKGDIDAIAAEVEEKKKAKKSSKNK